ncbi:periplasmic chaperone for outer membrane proteins Skp [Salinimicrobium sediminis]|uniref:Periplasmic chaperone for outer membrane proteins Skp n=1 Tax=Salinimicrobium sediminis TaxID=1343891 RepID=A0A285X2C1_9FLAO|nr:OmpH family outer membrane protein [Salinimicrobium sediminis]SOC78519.1 periplasmic chaperone for outer membrane proteins Skp [Salinimicrobium sediminis]
MKKYFLIFSLAMVSFSAMAQSKIGTIDAEYILNQMPEMTGVNEGIQTYNQELQKELETNVAKYETLVKDYQANNTTFSEEDKKAKESEIIGLENDIKGFRQKAGVMMQMKRNELTQPIYEKINAAMLEVVNEENFTQIFHAGGTSLAFSAEEFDITMKVLKKLGIAVKE